MNRILNWLLLGDNLLTVWSELIIRAIWQGSIAFGLVWLILKVFPKILPVVGCWLWRIVFLKFIIVFWEISSFRIPWLSSLDILHSPVGRFFNLKPVSQLITANHSILKFTSNNNISFFSSPKFWFILWILGICWFGARLVWLWNRSCKNFYPVSQYELTDLYAKICGQIKINKVPRLFLSDTITSPSLQGLIHPKIILPANILSQYNTTEIKLILAHELAHFKRCDLLWNWLPIVARGLFFFHPLVWMAEREWNEWREICCDSQAVQITRSPQADYGKVLLMATLGSGIGLKAGIQLPYTAEYYLPESKRILKKRLVALGNRFQISQKWAAASFFGLVLFGAVVIIPWQLSPSVFFIAQADCFPVSNLSIYGVLADPDKAYIKNFQITIDNQKITGEYSINSGGQSSSNSFKGYLLLNETFKLKRPHLIKVFVATDAGNLQEKYIVNSLADNFWIN